MRKFLITVVILGLLMVLVVGCAGSEPETPDGLFLTVMQPLDESIINTDEVAVIGNTLPHAIVSVNGNLVKVDEGGNFTMTISLEEGPNLIEVIASDLEGNQESSTLATIYVPSDASENDFFLTVTQPVDNTTTANNKTEVEGLTIPGGVVTVNGELVKVDEGGNFTMTISLEEGPNLIEVIASDPEGNQESSTLSIIYVP